MKPNSESVLTINAGSSSIKFALYQSGEKLQLALHGKVDRIGLSGTTLTFNGSGGDQTQSLSLSAENHKSAADFLLDWLEEQKGFRIGGGGGTSRGAWHASQRSRAGYR